MRTLTLAQGFHLSNGSLRRRTIQGWLALGFVLVAAAWTLSAATQAIGADPSPGISTDTYGTVLTEVLPGGPAWHRNAQVGDRVLSLEPGEIPEDWVMETDGGTLRKSGMIAVLRGTIPLALVGLALAGLAVLLLPGDTRAAAAVAAVAVALTERTLMATGDVAWSTAGAVAAMVLPGLWFVGFGPGPPWVRLLVGTVTAAVTGFWLWARYWQASLFEVADVLRVLLTYGLVIGIVVVVIGGAIREARGGYDVRRLGDVLVIALVMGAVAIAVLAAVAPEPLIIIVAIPLLAYPLVRGRMQLVLDRLVLGDLRSRASIEAVERERSRVSREIHDEPLQRLAALARRLDVSPATAREAAELRLVSSQLRDLSVQLHPPVLADLGLGAALGDLADRLGRTSGMHIAVDLGEDPLSMPAGRPPPEVELAAYRVAQEALANAVHHSGAQRIGIHGHVQAEVIELVVTDDGVGIDDVAERDAIGRGHVGLRSMAERAALIGARLRIEPAHPGTHVSLTWPA